MADTSPIFNRCMIINKYSLLAASLSVLFILSLIISSHADDSMRGESVSGTARFSGVVTAVDTNGNVEGRCFTAHAEDGTVKVFCISTLEDLDVGDRVELTYEKSDRFPLMVKRVRFVR
jgi:hypothetical protein